MNGKYSTSAEEESWFIATFQTATNWVWLGLLGVHQKYIVIYATHTVPDWLFSTTDAQATSQLLLNSFLYNNDVNGVYI